MDSFSEAIHIFLKERFHMNNRSINRKKRLSKTRRAALKEMNRRKKAANKEKKHKEKLYKAECNQLNRLLVRVGKKTHKTLGVFAVEEAAGVFRKDEEKWFKVYKIIGINDENKVRIFNDILPILTIKTRVTIRIDGNNRKEYYLSFFTTGDIYEVVKKQFESEIEKINTIVENISMVEISVRDYLKEIRKNYKFDSVEDNLLDGNIQKQDWRKLCFKEIQCSDDYFCFDRYYGLCMNTIQFSTEVEEDFIQDILDDCGELLYVLDLQPLDEEMKADFDRILAKRYNKEIDTNAGYINAGLFLVVLLDDSDKKERTINNIEHVFSNQDMVIAPVYGNTIESAFTFGLSEYGCMRNIEVSEVKKLIL